MRKFHSTILPLVSDMTQASSAADIIPGRPTWQQTMLRIANPEKSIPFYTDIMGMTLIDTLDFPQYDFKLFFLTTLPEGENYDLTPGTQEAHVCMELLYFFHCWSFYTKSIPLTIIIPATKQLIGLHVVY